MKKYLILAICLLPLAVYASKKAVTDEGEIVILDNDGTWQYEQPESIKTRKILLNQKLYKKGKKATFTLKSKVNDSQFSIDPKVWAFKKGDDSDSSEYNFKLKGGDLYGMAITEGIEVELLNLPQLALQNAKDAAPNIKIIKQEYRIVNGHKVIYMEMQGTIQGIKFKYLGYYYSDKSGSTQYITYTGSSLVKKYESEIEKFLNGFSIQ